MFDQTSTTRTSAVSTLDTPPSTVDPRTKGADDHTAYVRAAVDGYGAALGEIVAQLGPGAVAPGRLPELWDAFDRLERLAATGKMVLGHRAA